MMVIERVSRWLGFTTVLLEELFILFLIFAIEALACIHADYELQTRARSALHLTNSQPTGTTLVCERGHRGRELIISLPDLEMFKALEEEFQKPMETNVNDPMFQALYFPQADDDDVDEDEDVEVRGAAAPDEAEGAGKGE